MNIFFKDIKTKQKKTWQIIYMFGLKLLFKKGKKDNCILKDPDPI